MKQTVYLDGAELDKAFEEFKAAVMPIFSPPVTPGFERTRDGAVLSIHGSTMEQLAQLIEVCRQNEMAFIVGMHSAVSGYPALRLTCNKKVERVIHY
jgi:hypothetical protein